MSYEAELFALAALLFLYDSTVLLYTNEAILSCDRQGLWHVSLGSNEFLIAGRRVCFLNPLAMFRPCVRLCWNIGSQDPSGADESWSAELPKLGVAAPWTAAGMLALFGLLPLGFFTPISSYAILPAVVVLYGSILFGFWVMRRRCTLPALTRARLAGLLFECMACPPFGVNLVRHVGLMINVREPLLMAAARLLPAAERHRLRVHCLATLDQELARHEESSAERNHLEQERARLAEWGRPQ